MERSNTIKNTLTKMILYPIMLLLLAISLLKIYMISIGYHNTLSRYPEIETVLPLLIAFLFWKKGKFSRIILLIISVIGTVEIGFFSTRSSYFSVYSLANPVLEFLMHLKYSIKLAMVPLTLWLSIFFFLANIIFVITPYGKRYFIIK